MTALQSICVWSCVARCFINEVWPILGLQLEHVSDIGRMLHRAFGPAWTVLYVMMGVASWQVMLPLSAARMRFADRSRQSRGSFA